MSQLSLAIRFARREMRTRLSGFRIFFACLVLGVTAIAGVESLSTAFDRSVGRWRHDLSQEQLHEVEAEAGELLRELGYR